MEEKKKDGRGNPRIGELGKATRFQPGNSLGGRTPMTPEQKALAIKTRENVSELLNKYITLSLVEVKELLAEQKLPIIDLVFLKNLEKALEDGSMERMDWILNHMMGTLAKQINIKNVSPINLKNLSSDQLKTMREIIQAQEKENNEP